MKSFLISARKYRPTLFGELRGQLPITTTLQNAIKKQQLAQSFLFCGPKGSGKTSCARILAKAINCLQPTPAGEPCNRCSSCQDFQSNTSLNLHELDAASHNSVEDIRNLTEQVRYLPPYGKKVFIIDEAHMLSNSAFNAFLKTLEEPPSHTAFILATTEKHKILPTILSRCQIFDFQPITPADIVAHLTAIAAIENQAYETTALELISQAAEGSLRDALSRYDLVATFQAGGPITYEATLHHLHLLNPTYYFQLVEALYHNQIAVALQLYHQIIQMGFEGEQLLVGLGQHLRNLYICQVAPALPLINVPTHLQPQYHRAKPLPLSFLTTALEHLHTCQLQYKASLTKQLDIELLIIKLAQPGAAVPPTTTVTNPTTQPQRTEAANQPEALLPVKKNKPLSASTTSTPPSFTAGIDKSASIVVPPKANRAVDAASAVSPATLASEAQPKKTMKIPTHLTDILLTTQVKDLASAPLTTGEVVAVPAETAIRAAWAAYAQGLQPDSPTAYQVMQHPLQVAEGRLVLLLENPSQMDLLKDFQTTLLNHLRQALNYPPLSLEAVIAPAKDEPLPHKPYTLEEKWAYLAKEYPPLVQVRERLALELY